MKNETAGHAFWVGVMVTLLCVLFAVRCKSAPHTPTLDDILSRADQPIERVSIDVTGTAPVFSSAIPQAFRASAATQGISGCRGNGPYPALHVSAPRVGWPVRIAFWWPPHEGTPMRFLVVSSRVEPTPFVQNCTLVGPSEWVLSVTGTWLDLPAPPSALEGSEWGLQALQVDPPDATGAQRVRLSAGIWAKIGGGA